MSTLRVIITGAPKDAGKLTKPLKDKGVQTTYVPTIRTTLQPLSMASKRALADIETYDFLFFTSVQAVQYFCTVYRKKIAKPFPRVAAVGPATAKACRAAGMKVSFVPKQFTVADLVQVVPSIEGKRILFPRSNIAPREVISTMRKKGAYVQTIPLYSTTRVLIPQKKLETTLNKRNDCITFMSNSSVQSFSAALRSAALKKRGYALPAVCIGPRTADGARKAGFTTVVVADNFTTNGIIRAIRHLS